MAYLAKAGRDLKGQVTMIQTPSLAPDLVPKSNDGAKLLKNGRFRVKNYYGYMKLFGNCY